MGNCATTAPRDLHKNTIYATGKFTRLPPVEQIIHHNQNVIISKRFDRRKLISGYNRICFGLIIPEINNICIAFYEENADIIGFGEHNNWLSTIRVGHPILMRAEPKHCQSNHTSSRDCAPFNPLSLYPITQYIDCNLQIAYGYMSQHDSYGFGFFGWSGFLCIDLQTKAVHKLKCSIDSTTKYV